MEQRVEQQIKKSALTLLARREHSRQDLQRKLCLRGFAIANIVSVLDDLESENLLNETRFVASFIRMRIAQGMGPLKIYAALKKQGLADDSVKASDEWLAIHWQERAIAVRIKRFGEEIPKEISERQRQARFLQQRGFTLDHIRTALKFSR